MNRDQSDAGFTLGPLYSWLVMSSGLAMEIGFIAYNFEAFGHLFPVDGVGAALSVLGIVTFTIGAWAFEDETEVDTA